MKTKVNIKVGIKFSVSAPFFEQIITKSNHIAPMIHVHTAITIFITFTHLIYIFGYLWTKVTIFAFMKTYTSNHIIFFSPTHTSAKIARAIGESIGMGRRIEIDLTTDENSSPIEIKDSITIIAVPVYAGRVAPIALQRLRRLKGNNAPAILVAVYGNRDYEDALVELRDETIQL